MCNALFFCDYRISPELEIRPPNNQNNIMSSIMVAEPQQRGQPHIFQGFNSKYLSPSRPVMKSLLIPRLLNELTEMHILSGFCNTCDIEMLRTLHCLNWGWKSYVSSMQVWIALDYSKYMVFEHPTPLHYQVKIVCTILENWHVEYTKRIHL